MDAMGRVDVLDTDQHLIQEGLNVLGRQILRGHDQFVQVGIDVVKHHVQVPEVGKIGILMLLLHLSLRWMFGGQRWRLLDPLDVHRFHYVQQIDYAIMALEPTKDVHLTVESDRIDLLVESASNALYSHVRTVAMIVGVIMRVFRFRRGFFFPVRGWMVLFVNVRGVSRRKVGRRMRRPIGQVLGLGHLAIGASPQNAHQLVAFSNLPGIEVVGVCFALPFFGPFWRFFWCC
mmetsp:Transcript_15636/g.45182  ORF Transcript_15636/g.45182 Transcript_15636/m.45182 type:complete len:232 (+) Transcript_15636:983-1678(+)